MTTFLSATFTSADTSPGTVPNADTGQAFTQGITYGGNGTAGWKVLSNTLIDQSTANESDAVADSGVSDGVVSVRLAALPAGDGGLVCRMDSALGSTNLLLNCEPGYGYHLYKRVAGGYTQIGAIPMTPAVNDVLTFTLAGSSVIASVGAGSVSVTETSGQTNTWVGVRSSNSGGSPKTLAFDDLHVSDGLPDAQGALRRPKVQSRFVAVNR